MTATAHEVHTYAPLRIVIRGSVRSFLQVTSLIVGSVLGRAAEFYTEVAHGSMFSGHLHRHGKPMVTSLHTMAGLLKKTVQRWEKMLPILLVLTVR
mmetsp:Transcript_98592/g.154052  ORF Transcript_98592/g.154052 Transcript_98592/m.154052 type:complete len:96 (-) Transcript_98592:682-969(-)